MNRNGIFVQTALRCFIVAVCSELLFRLFSFATVFDMGLIRITLFSAAYALIAACICSLLPLKAGKTLSFAVPGPRR